MTQRHWSDSTGNGQVGEGKVHLEDTLCFKTHWPVMNTPEPEVSRFVMVLRHPLDAALSYASYSLSSNNVRYRQSYVVEQPYQHTPPPTRCRHTTT